MGVGRHSGPALSLQRREVQALLAAEVARDQRRVDPGALADLPQRRAVVAALVEEPSAAQRREGSRRRRAVASASCVVALLISLLSTADDISLLTLPQAPHARTASTTA